MQAIDAYGVGKVVASGHPDFEKDDLVIGLISWGEYSIVKEGSILNKLNSLGFPYTYHVGILGIYVILGCLARLKSPTSKLISQNQLIRTFCVKNL